MKKQTRKDLILKMLSKPGTNLTCADLCKKIIKKQSLTGNIAHYLSGSISSILTKLVKGKELKYAKGKGPRGGHLYEKR